MFKTIIVMFFLINAIFWGLYDHATHCSVASMMGIKNCPSHTTHLLMGVISFMIAIYVQQKYYIDSLMK